MLPLSLSFNIQKVKHSQLNKGASAQQTRMPDLFYIWGFPAGLDGKESACIARDPGLIPGLGRSPGEGNGSPLQYSCLENPMDRGAW